jgi:uncharacterized protein
VRSDPPPRATPSTGSATSATRSSQSRREYRDSQNREVDAIVEARGVTWGAFEVKLGGDAAIDGAAASLLKFARQIDGVAVVPIGALGP